MLRTVLDLDLDLGISSPCNKMAVLWEDPQSDKFTLIHPSRFFPFSGGATLVQLTTTLRSSTSLRLLPELSDIIFYSFSLCRYVPIATTFRPSTSRGLPPELFEIILYSFSFCDHVPKASNSLQIVILAGAAS